MQCEEWDDANSELFKESHDEAVHKNSYKSRLYELISASLVIGEEKVLRIDGPCRAEGSEGSKGSEGDGGRPCGNGKW
jgi:hypothetical protein